MLEKRKLLDLTYPLSIHLFITEGGEQELPWSQNEALRITSQLVLATGTVIIQRTAVQFTIKTIFMERTSFTGTSSLRTFCFPGTRKR